MFRVHPCQRQHGLTLIELLATVAVFAILTGVGVPSFRNVMANQKQTAAVNSYIASFQQARMRAVAQASQVVLCPSTNGITCTGGLSWEHGWLIYDDDNRNRRHDAGEAVVAVFTALPPGLAATSSVGRPQLVYRGDGSATGSNLRLTLCDQRGTGHARAIVINNHGRPRSGPDEVRRCQPGPE